MTFYLLKPCKGYAGYLSTTKKSTKVDLKSLIGDLESHGYEVLDVKHLLVAKKEMEITIYPNGKLLVKTDDKEEARKAVESIYEIIFPER
ncbi:MAG: hypothetical protein JSV43_00445 [Methanobacteriota archaeon]|nr:MAG: hypothetical protein JSV43_00445 [Euryarchaeota archaeon]